MRNADITIQQEETHLTGVSWQKLSHMTAISTSSYADTQFAEKSQASKNVKYATV